MKKAIAIIGAVMLAIVILSIALVVKLINIIIPSAESQPAVNTTCIEQVLSSRTETSNDRTLSIVLEETEMTDPNVVMLKDSSYLEDRYGIHLNYGDAFVDNEIIYMIKGS